MSDPGGPLAGRLTKDRLRASMPVDAPYYQAPPFFWRDARSLSVIYETDADAAADLLPEGVELPLPAQAVLMVIHYPWSTVGPYNEAIQGLRCSWEGAPHIYIARIVVDEVPPLVIGRELYGYPKQMASIELSTESELMCGRVERPAGLRLVTATVRPERPAAALGAGDIGTLSLRVIPSPEQDAPPSVAELVRVPSTDRETHEAWLGSATLQYDATSDLDPWHGLPVRQVLGGMYTRSDFTLPYAQVVRRY